MTRFRTTQRFGALGRLAGDCRGVTAVEMALACSAVCLFVIGIMQTGQALWVQNALTYSVAEAARCASINTSTCGTSSQIQSYAATASSYVFDTSVFTVSTPSCGNQVAATYPMNLNVFNISLSLNLTAQACFPI